MLFTALFQVIHKTQCINKHNIILKKLILYFMNKYIESVAYSKIEFNSFCSDIQINKRNLILSQNIQNSNLKIIGILKNSLSEYEFYNEYVNLNIDIISSILINLNQMLTLKKKIKRNFLYKTKFQIERNLIKLEKTL